MGLSPWCLPWDALLATNRLGAARGLGYAERTMRLPQASRSSATFAACLGAALFAVSAGARAEERTSSLSWLRLEGAESCVATQDLAKAVETRLGRVAFVSAAQADLSIEGHVRRTGSVYRAEVRVRDAAGRPLGARTLEDASCPALREPLALVIALMIDPEAASRPTPAPAPTATATATATAVEPQRVETREVVRREVVVVREAPSGWRGEGDVHAALATGLLPEAAFGVGAGAWLRGPGWPALAASAAYWVEQSPSVPSAQKGPVLVQLDFVQAGAALCPLIFEHPSGPRLTALACGGGQLGLMRGAGLGFDRSGRESQLTLHWTLEAKGSVGLFGPVILHAGIAGLVSGLGPQRFAYSTGADLVTVHQLPRFAALGTLGLGVHLP